MKIFDSHVHIFPNKIASKASVNIGHFYDIPMDFDGSVETQLKLMEEDGVDKCLVHSVATVAAQVSSINDFIASQVKEHSDKFVGFCTLHPDLSSEEIDRETDKIISSGLKGIKLHPDFQLFNIDSREAYKIYEIAEAKSLPILFHTGDIRHGYSSPEKLVRALDDFPELTVIGAHFGGWSEWDNGVSFLAGRDNVFVDTSSSTYASTPEKIFSYINAFGDDRVLFASDYPMWRVGDEIKFIDSLPLSDTSKEKIFWNNAAALLGF